ncbi:MAG: response regulator [Oligoflexia bacterium]|nr:response regulator [Oligoflexia bacterium]
MKALIVEDDKVSSTLLQGMLSPWGEVETAGQGEEAFNKFCDAYSGAAPFDILFLDLGLPEVDGYQALRAIREYEQGFGKFGSDQTKVVVLTGSKQPHDLFKAESFGCVAYLTKPLDRTRLLEELERLGFFSPK